MAVVTGANRGIGLEVCRQLAEKGCRVVLTSRDAEKGKAAAKQLGQKGLEVSYCTCDVTKEDSIKKLAQYVGKEFGRADILVNNAAIYIDKGGVLDVPTDVYRDTMETNTLGPLRMCKAFIPMMVKNGYGRVVNVSSESGQFESLAGYTPAYAVSKAALNALTVMLAGAVGGNDILINAGSPGWVRTRMGGPSAPGSVEEGADTIVWLATLPAGGASGGFFRDRKRIPW